jgi:hypothetical protein
MADTSDVKLLADQIRIEGRRQVIVDALDLCVDSADRRSEHTSPDRRALVHDGGDKLTINYAYDYPHGVKIEGLHEVNALPKKVETGIGGVAQRAADHLTITGNTKIAGRLTIDGDLNGKVRVKWIPPEQGLGAALVVADIKDKKEAEIPLDTLLSTILSLALGRPLQDGWRWCKNCGALFHAGKKGVCPAGGEHSQEGSSHYFVPLTANF